MKKKWENYEDVSIYLLNQISKKFGLSHVENKQKLSGLATEWEIDGKGVLLNDTAFIVIECRRYTTSKLPQKELASLAYTIKDLGAEGGILVSPLGLQAGAEKIAQFNNIISVKLSPNSTTSEYILSFLNEIHAGFSECVTGTATFQGGSLESVKKKHR